MQKVAIVGCGKIADGHVEMIRSCGLGEVVAVCDRNAEMARQLSIRYGIEGTYDDMQTMFASVPIDVVHIATPPDSHVFLSIAAFAAGKHVFLEKPFALTAPETNSILSAAKTSGKLVSVNHLFRFESPFVELQQLIKKGDLGEVVHIDTNYGYDLNGDFGKALLGDENHWVHQLPGKLFQNVLDHIFCKLVDFLPEKNATVTAQTFRRRPATGIHSFDNLNDELRVQIRSGNATAAIFISASIKPVSHVMTVYGTRNSYSLDFGARTIVPIARQTTPSAIGRLMIAPQVARNYAKNFGQNLTRFRKSEFHFFMGMRCLLAEFYTSCARHVSPPIEYDYIQATANYIDRTVRAVSHDSQPTES
jgi:predicted dehydrogenase